MILLLLVLTRTFSHTVVSFESSAAGFKAPIGTLYFRGLVITYTILGVPYHSYSIIYPQTYSNS